MSPRNRALALAPALALSVLVPTTGAEAAASVALRTDRDVPGHPWPGHPGRHLMGYTVRSGDSPGAIATRFHAWTDELSRLNHWSGSTTLQVGERIRVPVVVHAWRRAHRGPERSGLMRHATREQVRGYVVRAARRYGVSPRLALAIAWQESGWQQDVTSPVGAIGTMQVLPVTGRWLSSYTGRRLYLRHLPDNVTAGVLLLKILRGETTRKRAIASYYQGLGALRKHGMYRDTKHYVRSVQRIQSSLEAGWDPS